jgi:hypothetical protein
MNYLYNLLFNPLYEDSIQLLEDFFVFLIICGLIFFVIYLLFNKVFTANSKVHRDFQLNLNILWSLVTFEVLIGGLFFFFLFRFQGIDFLAGWNEVDFYLGLFHQIMLFFVFIPILFMVFYNKYNQSIKNTIK